MTTPASIGIYSDGQWFNTTVTLRDAEGNDMVVPVESFVLSAAVGAPTRLTIATVTGVQIDLECPVVERGEQGEEPEAERST